MKPAGSGSCIFSNQILVGAFCTKLWNTGVSVNTISGSLPQESQIAMYVCVFMVAAQLTCDLDVLSDLVGQMVRKDSRLFPLLKLLDKRARERRAARSDGVFVHGASGNHFKSARCFDATRYCCSVATVEK